MPQKKTSATEKAALRRKAAAELRATLKRSKLALEESQHAHEQAERVAAQLEEDTATEHLLIADTEARDYTVHEEAPITPLKKKPFWERVGDWFTS